MRAVCCQVEVPATGWSLVQESSTECVVSECDHTGLTMSRPGATVVVDYENKY